MASALAVVVPAFEKARERLWLQEKVQIGSEVTLEATAEIARLDLR